MIDRNGVSANGDTGRGKTCERTNKARRKICKNNIPNDEQGEKTVVGKEDKGRILIHGRW